jgi:hypothetical protein
MQEARKDRRKLAMRTTKTATRCAPKVPRVLSPPQMMPRFAKRVCFVDILDTAGVRLDRRRGRG